MGATEFKLAPEQIAGMLRTVNKRYIQPSERASGILKICRTISDNETANGRHVSREDVLRVFLSEPAVQRAVDAEMRTFLMHPKRISRTTRTSPSITEKRNTAMFGNRPRREGRVRLARRG